MGSGSLATTHLQPENEVFTARCAVGLPIVSRHHRSHVLATDTLYHQPGRHIVHLPGWQPMEYSSRDDATVRIINTITATMGKKKRARGVKGINPASTTLFPQFGAELNPNGIELACNRAGSAFSSRQPAYRWNWMSPP